VTVVKLKAQLAGNASMALEPHVPVLYAVPGKRIVGIVELGAVERSQPAPGEDKDPSVTLQIKSMEIAVDRCEDHLREALRALHTQRTAYGTLNADSDVELSESTIERLGADVIATEAARLHVAIQRWGDYARQVVGNPKLTASAVRIEMATVADGLLGLIHPELLAPKNEV
jgi:hypothetical protein